LERWSIGVMVGATASNGLRSGATPRLADATDLAELEAALASLIRVAKNIRREWTSIDRSLLSVSIWNI
jgi:hypothetical protein